MLNLRSRNLTANLRARAAVLGLIFALGACAPTSRLPQVDPEAQKQEAALQREFVVKDLIDRTIRLYTVAHPILTRSADLCGKDVRLAAGFVPMSRSYFKRDFQHAARRALGIDDNIKVITVSAGSAADRAGLRAGDKILALNGVSVAGEVETADSTPSNDPRPNQQPDPASRTSLQTFLVRMQDIAEAGESWKLTVQRGNETLALTITPEPVCRYDIIASDSNELNAFADGKRVVINAAMMRFAQADVELATVVGHEIAHNMQRHIDAKIGNYALGSIVDILFAAGGIYTGGAFGKLGAGVFSQEFEAEADYVGLYLAARAGYAIGTAPNFWRRMAAANPSSIKNSHTASHPPTPQRFLALEKTVAEITAKQAAGQPLIPEKRANDKPAEAPPEQPAK
jgi:hypothetical protein